MPSRPEVKIFGEPHRLRAHVEVMNSYSAHADEPELVEFVGNLDAERLKKIFLVHGTLDRMEPFGESLDRAGFREDARTCSRGSSDRR